MIFHPLTFCRWLGHRRVYTESQRMRMTRRGWLEMRPRVLVHCKRCGMGGDDCYESSRLERLVEAWQRFRWAVEEAAETPVTIDNSDIPF